MHIRPGNRIPWPVLGAVAVVIFAGCSDDDGPADEADKESPLAEYLGAGAMEFDPNGGMTISFGGGNTAAFEGGGEQMRRMRERASECMADQGFEYFVTGSDERVFEHLTEVETTSPEEFVEEYGYGISTAWNDDLEVAEDPNEEYRRSLSPQAQRAYDRALHGTDEAWAQDEPDVADRGCFAIASDEIASEKGVDGLADEWAEFEDLLRDITALQYRVVSDARVVEAAERWGDCMADAGHPDFSDLGEPRYSVFERIYEVGEWADEEEWDVFIARALNNRAVAVPEGLRAAGPDVLRDIREYELEIAATDFSCRVEHYTQTFDTVVYEVQEEFIEQHHAELDVLRDWLAEGNATHPYFFNDVPLDSFE